MSPEYQKQVETCRAWLRLHATPRKTINKRRSSYGLKHTVESWCRSRGLSFYVPNDAFITAAQVEGYRSQRIGNGPNFHFNIQVNKGT